MSPHFLGGGGQGSEERMIQDTFKYKRLDRETIGVILSIQTLIYINLRSSRINLEMAMNGFTNTSKLACMSGVHFFTKR